MPNKKAFTTEEFVKRITEIHGDKYDFSKVEYVRLKGKVIVGCKEHGEFESQAMTLLDKKCLCPVCKKTFRNMRRTNFIRMGIEKFGNKFEYIDVPESVGYNTRIAVDCKDHGVFTIIAGNFITTVQHACPKCANIARSISVSLRHQHRKEIRDKTFPKITNPKYLPQPKEVKYPDSKSMSSLIRGLRPSIKV